MDIGQILVTIADSCENAFVTEEAKRVESPPIPEKFTLTQRVHARAVGKLPDQEFSPA